MKLYGTENVDESAILQLSSLCMTDKKYFFIFLVYDEYSKLIWGK